METNVAFYDTKPYDRMFFEKWGESKNIHWDFYDFRLSAETVFSAKGAEVVCVFVNDKLDRACLNKLQEMGVKHVALRCAGFNNVDLASAKEFGLSVTRVPSYSPHAVAEHAVALLLSLNRKIYRAYNRVREHNFSLNGLVGFDVFGKTVGIIGTGRIGKIAAQIFKGFETNVVAYDPYPSKEWAHQYGIQYVDLPTILKTSDIISLHVPLSPETFHLFKSDTFALLKPGAVLINTSRGKLIDTTALIDSLKSGQLGGVALDVYEEEEGIFFEDLSDQLLQDDELTRLLTFPNVLITSHQAFLTKEALMEISRVTTDNIQRMKRGESFLAGTEVKLISK